MDDELRQLGSRLAAGEESAYARLYDLYAARMFAAAFRMLGRRADAEDAVQDVFVSLVRSRTALANIADLAAYLFVCLRRSAGRVAQGRPADAPLEHDPPEQADEGGSGDERAARLRAAVDRLPAEQRDVVALKLDADLTFEQVAAVLGTNPSTAASRYRYALAKLRQMLGGAFTR
ncbi:MAG: sigma-70 family RNA polymerase sigma factor [Phycisphaerae bacterium]|nr:sigma-70 family RNA polymerase sigma factor [Phycisphaerae bacterium]